jgi:hypothetical protein
MIELRAPVEAADVKERADRFKCLPYKITITAESCCKRRALVRAGIKKIEFLNCGEDCPIGKVVEANSGGPVKVSTALTDGAAHTGKHFKLMQASQFGTVFEGPDRREAPDKKELQRERQRKYQRERYQKQKLAKASASGAAPSFAVIAGGREEPDEPTIPAFGDSMLIAQPLPKAPPGRAVTEFPAVDVKPSPWGNPAHEVATSIALGKAIRAVADKAGPAISPAPEDEENIMPICTYAGCKKITRPGKFKEPPPPGTEGFCKRHRKAFLNGDEAKPKATKRVKAVKAPKPARRAKPGPKPKVARRGSPHSNGAAGPASVRDQVTQAFEALELVSRIGWDRARTMASMFDDVRAGADSE